MHRRNRLAVAMIAIVGCLTSAAPASAGVLIGDAQIAGITVSDGVLIGDAVLLSDY